jgi:hypothetical protein
MLGARALQSANLPLLSFVASAKSGTGAVTIPSSAQAGDLCVVFDAASDSSSWTFQAPPTGFTNIKKAVGEAGFATYYFGYGVSYKILVAADVGASVNTTNKTDETAILFVFRPTRPIRQVRLSTWLGQITEGNPSSQAIAATDAAAPVIVLALNNGSSGSGFSVASPAFDATVVQTDGTSLQTRAGYKIYNANQVDHTVDKADDTDGNMLVSGWLSVV